MKVVFLYMKKSILVQPAEVVRRLEKESEEVRLNINAEAVLNGFKSTEYLILCQKPVEH